MIIEKIYDDLTLHCARCGKELDIFAKVCNECGAYVHSMQDGEDYNEFKEKLRRIQAAQNTIQLKKLREK